MRCRSSQAAIGPAYFGLSRVTAKRACSHRASAQSTRRMVRAFSRSPQSTEAAWHRTIHASTIGDFPDAPQVAHGRRPTAARLPSRSRLQRRSRWRSSFSSLAHCAPLQHELRHGGLLAPRKDQRRFRGAGTMRIAYTGTLFHFCNLFNKIMRAARTGRWASSEVAAVCQTFRASCT